MRVIGFSFEGRDLTGLTGKQAALFILGMSISKLLLVGRLHESIKLAGYRMAWNI